MRRALRRLAPRPAGLLALGILASCAAGCGAGAAPSVTRATTTTTTTTLPAPVAVDSTAPLGGFALLGPVVRVGVVSLPPGATAPPTGSLAPAAAAGLPRLAYRQFGAGPDLLLVAGEHATMTSWDPELLTALAGHYRVTVVDLPGVGYSSPVAHFSLPVLADLLAGLVVGLGLAHPSVLGWGLGAEIALSLAERHADLLSDLVLLEPIGGATRTLAPSRAVSATLASPLATNVELARISFPADQARARDAYLSRLSEIDPDDLVAGAIADEARLVASLEAHSPVAGGLGAIRLRVLVVTGTDDVVARPSNGLLLAGAIHGARLVRLRDAGYEAASSDEAAFLAVLTGFTAAAPPARS